jgi:hypothetical protein
MMSRVAICLALAICAEAFTPATLPSSVSCRAAQRTGALCLRAESPDRDVVKTRRASIQKGFTISVWAASVIAASTFSKARPAAASGNVGIAHFHPLRNMMEKKFKADPDFGPTCVRLAWHASGTYDKMRKTGGSGGGTIRFKVENYALNPQP